MVPTANTASIMHYGPRAFSSNRQPTIEALDGSAIGQRNGLGAGDIAAIESMSGQPTVSQPRPGVQLATELPARSTGRWFSGGWPANWNVNWQNVPAAQQTCEPPLVSWNLRAERQGPGTLQYLLEVENLCQSEVRFEWRYGLVKGNGNGHGSYDAVADEAPATGQPAGQADDDWAAASDAGGPPAWLSSGKQGASKENSGGFTDTGGPAIALDPISEPAVIEPERAPAVRDAGEEAYA